MSPPARPRGAAKGKGEGKRRNPSTTTLRVGYLPAPRLRQAGGAGKRVYKRKPPTLGRRVFFFCFFLLSSHVSPPLRSGSRPCVGLHSISCKRNEDRSPCLRRISLRIPRRLPDCSTCTRTRPSTPRWCRWQSEPR